jgi:hypothetical protein
MYLLKPTISINTQGVILSEPACCVHVIDVGTQDGIVQSNLFKMRQIALGWELACNQTTKARSPQVVYKTYDMSFAEGSALRQDLESWMGDEFKDRIRRFDLKSILGKYCMLTLSSSSGENGEVHHFVNEITPLSSDLEQKTLVKPLTRYGVFMISEPDMDLFDNLPFEIQELIKKSPEFVSAQHSQSSEDDY